MKFGLAIILLFLFLGLQTPVSANYSPGFYKTQGSRIVDNAGNEIIIQGVNYGGPLYHAKMGDKTNELALVKAAGFDTIRVLFTTQALDEDYIDKGLESFDMLINGATKAGLKVILDRHRLKFSDTTESALWYSDEYSQERWINDWRLLAQRYKNNTTVIGADLHNEPHGQACWGCGDSNIDWREAAQTAGKAIQQVNPDWLIFVEGVEKGAWWGGNLSWAKKYPIVLTHPNKVVYSAHDYGFAVNGNGPDYLHNNFPDSLVPWWDSHWGYLVDQNIAPVWIGEFGTNLKGSDLVWFKYLTDYLKAKRISWAYFSWHMQIGDDTGFLTEDGTPRTDLLAKIDQLRDMWGELPSTVPGDANGDSHVNFSDYLIWKAHYKEKVTSGNRSVGDFNSDGVVDGLDYTILYENYER